MALAPDTPPDRRLRGSVVLREALGAELMVHFTVEGARRRSTEDVKELAQDIGDDREGGIQTEGTVLSGVSAPRAHVTRG